MKPRKKRIWRFSREWRRLRKLPSMAIMTSDGGRAPTSDELDDMYRLPPGTSVATDSESARWVADALADAPFATVRGDVPAGFEAYARILHPAHRWDTPGENTLVRWTEVAAETGRTVHRLMQFERIAGLPDDPRARPSWGDQPRPSGLCDVAEALLRVLREHTSTPDRCVLALWEGRGGYDMVPWLVRARRFSKPHRTYILFEGPLEAVRGFCEPFWEPPNVWWPHDRAWCAATDIDIPSTYVGGTRACIEAILADPDLEAFPAELDDPIHIGSDTINPPNRAD